MTTYEDAYVARQIELEQEMFRASAEKLRADIAKARAADREDDTPYAHRLMVGKIAEVAEGVRAIQTQAAAGKAGRPSIAGKFLTQLEPEVAAALALRGVLSGVTKRRSMQRLCVQIGKLVEDELLWRTFEAQAPEAAKITEKHLKDKGSYRHRKRVITTMAGRAGVARIDMTEPERLNVGHALLEIVLERTDIVEVSDAQLGGAASKRMLYITPKPEALDWIERFTGWYAAVSPEFWPTVIPPRPWDGPFGGGYYLRSPRPLPLVKGGRRTYLSELEHVDMPGVYAAINAVQETAFRVDAWVLAVMEKTWGLGHQIAGLPRRDPLELPPKPADIETNEEGRKDWKKAAALVYADNVRLLSKRLQLDQGLKMARRFAEESAIYMPHQLDFRGRMYAVPLLSYQGPDWMKGLLRFAKGKPIDTEDQAVCLMVQGANLFGFDKGTIDERMGWVEEHAEFIEDAADEPLNDFWWADADNPWQFLQWCKEWVSFLRQGYGFVSSFICSADGTCNGLQHFSAMLRDPIGGAAVNLLPTERPSDIYAEVAKVVEGKLRLLSSGSGGVATKPIPPRTAGEWASAWLAFGVDRKITKRSVMTLPYGSTQYSCREFIEDAVRDRISGGGDNPFAFTTDGNESNGAFAASLFLAPLVWESIGEVVVAARDAMGWLKAVAKAVGDGGLPVNWTTPDGFPVQQAYYATHMIRVRLKAAGTAHLLAVRQERGNEIDKRRQAQGVSPNFVHSMDGTALRRYVVAGAEKGIDSFAVVHDSFGCVAADYDLMQETLRDAFVDLYETHDVLEELRAQVLAGLTPEAREGVPALPAKGSLDLSRARESLFFFA